MSTCRAFRVRADQRERKPQRGCPEGRRRDRRRSLMTRSQQGPAWPSAAGPLAASRLEDPSPLPGSQPWDVGPDLEARLDGTGPAAPTTGHRRCGRGRLSRLGPIPAAGLRILRRDAGLRDRLRPGGADELPRPRPPAVDVERPSTPRRIRQDRRIGAARRSLPRQLRQKSGTERGRSPPPHGPRLAQRDQGDVGPDRSWPSCSSGKRCKQHIPAITQRQHPNRPGNSSRS